MPTDVKGERRQGGTGSGVKEEQGERERGKGGERGTG